MNTNTSKFRKALLFIVAGSVLVTVIAATPFVTQQALAGHVSKIVMTSTVNSIQDPGEGHELHQIAMILPPSGNTIYSGIVTWSASELVEVVLLQNYEGGSDISPVIYRLEGKQYALSLIRTGADGKAASMGSMQFVGNALALHNVEGKQFTATVSIDGFQRIPRDQAPGSVLKLSSASVLMDIPLMKGYENGNEIYFIATDASDEQVAKQITNQTGFKVNFAPLLAQTPESARGQAYGFTNGIEGDGPFGFQLPVTNAKPGDEGYSPLWQLNLVKWKDVADATELKSVQQIMDAENEGLLTITVTETIVNHPVVKWQDGSLTIRKDADSINDDSPYMGGQVTKIDTENMVVTFVTHRGWGPDGKAVYYIVTDAVPEMPANMMGVPLVAADEELASTAVAVDLFQFMNGIKGSGPMGFQPGIGGANPDDRNYSPMWKISFIEWKDPLKARLLETVLDISEMQNKGSITVTPAMEGKHIVNCPFFDQQTVFEHMSKA